MRENQSPLVDLETSIHAAYRQRTRASLEWYDRASKSLVGGVSGTVRYFSPYPLYFTGGKGSNTTDIDGNRYIDCFLSGACLLLGHRSPAIMAALEANVGVGSLVLNPKLATEVAEMLQQMVPSAERVRFLNSGTEAVMSALRFARAFTGRPKIVKFLGTYHGMEDQMLVGLDGRGQRLGAGIPQEVVSHIAMTRFGDIEALRALLKSGDIAAVLVDPSMHHGGLWIAPPDYYHAVRQATTDAGALLIYDEVITGFRLAPGGGQEYFGVAPDLSVFGKAFGVGEKLGAVVGRADVMAVADPSRRTTGPFAFQSGTCNDSTFAQAAALAAMSEYRRLGASGGYKVLSGMAAKLGEGLRDAFAAHGIACHVNQLGPIVRIFFAEEPASYDYCSRHNTKPLDLFHLALLTEGVLTLPGSHDFFLSFAHTEKDIADIVAAARRVLARFEFAPVIERRSATRLQ